MTLKMIFAALALTVSPTLALAGGGCNSMKSTEASLTCAAGMTYDAATKACVTTTS